MSLYGDYIFERMGDHIEERDEGFATYRYLEDAGIFSVYIVDIYVRPEQRRGNVAAYMADQIVQKAKLRGCKRLIGSVATNSKSPTESIRVLLAYGMEFYKCNEHGLLFKKEI